MQSDQTFSLAFHSLGELFAQWHTKAVSVAWSHSYTYVYVVRCALLCAMRTGRVALVCCIDELQVE